MIDFNPFLGVTRSLIQSDRRAWEEQKDEANAGIHD